MKRQWALLGLMLVGCTTVPTAPIEDDVTVLPDVGVPVDRATPMDAGNPVEDQPPAPPPPPDVPRDTGPEPLPPLPAGGCLRLPTLSRIHASDNPTRVTVTSYDGERRYTNDQYAGFRLADGRVFFIHQHFSQSVPTSTRFPLGVAPNDRYATSVERAGIYFNCSMQPSGLYDCSSYAMARTGLARVGGLASRPNGVFSSALFNVVFQELRYDAGTGATTFVTNGACFTLDELNVRTGEVLYVVSGAPDSGTGVTRSSEGGQRLGSGASDSGVSYGACGTGGVACETGNTPACALEAGASQGTCISRCVHDADCPSGGTCVYGVASHYLRNPMEGGYCFRPCLAGGCSLPGFGCATVINELRESTSVCVPQDFITGDPTRACSPDPMRTYSPLYRVCGFNSGETYPCTPGARVTLGCNTGGAGAACGALGSCTGTPLLRVCPGDAPCGGWGAVSQAVNTCGTCPVTTFVCPPAGRVRVYSASLDPSMPSTCVVQQR